MQYIYTTCTCFANTCAAHSVHRPYCAPSIRALAILDISANNLGELVKGPLPEGWKSKDDDGREPWLRIADGHEQDEYPGEEKPEGLIAIANAIPALAMVSVNMMGNKIGKEQLSKLQEMMKEHPTLVSLCGIADDATEANLSGLEMDADDAVVLADELPAKGALTSLNLANNSVGSKGAKHVAEAIKVHVSALRFDFDIHFELDLTSGSTAVVYGYSYYNTTPRGQW